MYSLISLALIHASLISIQLQVNQIASSTPIAPQTPKIALYSEFTPEVEIWLKALQTCESGQNEKALNPKDIDGTPSKGLYQFKDKTFNWLSQKYGIATTSIWNGKEQDKIVRRMIYDKELNLRNQFPACIRKLGLPPLPSP